MEYEAREERDWIRRDPEVEGGGWHRLGREEIEEGQTGGGGGRIWRMGQLS